MSPPKKESCGMDCCSAEAHLSTANVARAVVAYSYVRHTYDRSRAKAPPARRHFFSLQHLELFPSWALFHVRTSPPSGLSSRTTQVYQLFCRFIVSLPSRCAAPPAPPPPIHPFSTCQQPTPPNLAITSECYSRPHSQHRKRRLVMQPPDGGAATGAGKRPGLVDSAESATDMPELRLRKEVAREKVSEVSRRRGHR